MGLACAARPSRLLAVPILCVYMTVYRDMVRLPQASRPGKQLAFLFWMYVYIHKEIMGLACAARPRPAACFPNVYVYNNPSRAGRLLSQYDNQHLYMHVRLPQASRPRQAAYFLNVYVCMHMYTMMMGLA